MKKGILAAALAVCVLFGGCSALLERSYSVVEPYADRYWDSSTEDALKVDSYQDLVNSLLMLIEQRAEETVIRCSDEVSSYQALTRARNEVRRETTMGSYLLQDIWFTFEDGASYASAVFHITYREDAEDPSGLMPLSDSQSLVDLLRLAVREEHEKLTARFTYDMPREAVTSAVESYWQELCREEAEVEAVSGEAGDVPGPPDGEPEDGAEDAPESEPEEEPEEAPETGPEEPAPSPEGGGEENGDLPPEDPDGEGEALVPEPVVYPPCPWIIRLYPDQNTAEIVEILLQKP